jgi:methyltransferase, FkbM family
VNELRPLVVFDVGANVGDYAQQVLSHLGGAVILHAFEPSVVAFATLENRFGSQRNVVLHNIGLGSIDGDQPFYGPAQGSPLSSVYHRHLNHFGIDMKALGTVRMRTLDSFCLEVGLQDINLLKLDVEGNELEVPRGAEWLLASRRIKRIQFEFGGSNIDSRTFLQDFFYLLSQQYRLFRIVRDGLWPIEPYRETSEIFVTWNVLAVLREGSAALVPETGLI